MDKDPELLDPSGAELRFVIDRSSALPDQYTSDASLGLTETSLWHNRSRISRVVN
jgi:hypothetical protein